MDSSRPHFSKCCSKNNKKKHQSNPKSSSKPSKSSLKMYPYMSFWKNVLKSTNSIKKYHPILMSINNCSFILWINTSMAPILLTGSPSMLQEPQQNYSRKILPKKFNNGSKIFICIEKITRTMILISALLMIEAIIHTQKVFS